MLGRDRDSEKARGRNKQRGEMMERNSCKEIEKKIKIEIHKERHTERWSPLPQLPGRRWFCSVWVSGWWVGVRGQELEQGGPM